MKQRFVCLRAALAFLMLAGCGGGTLSDNKAEQYTAGGGTVTEPIKNLEIQWVSGSVEICQGTEDQVTFRETADRVLSDDFVMGWRLEGETLYIDFCAANSWTLDIPDKALTVTLPQDLVLESVQVTTTSATFHAPALQAREVVCDTTSGDLTAQLLGTETIQVNTVSGAVEVTALDDAKQVKTATTSGNVNLTLGYADQLDVTTISGVTRITADECRQTDLNSTSGNVALDLQSSSGACEVTTVSGEVTLSLPENADAAVEFNTVSGSFDSALSLRKEGDCYLSGSGQNLYQVKTTSGSLRIEAKEGGSQGFGQKTEGGTTLPALASA